MATLQETLDPDARAFCEREGLRDALAAAIRLVGEYFPDARDLRVRLEWDPDNPRHEWLSVDYVVSGPVDELIDRDNHMLDRWLQEAPRDALGKVIVTFGVE